MNIRPRLTYANVVATLALVLAIGGGTVYAAVKLGKNDVKSKNIAKGAVKGSDLGKNAVTGPKVKDGSLGLADLAKGVIRSDVTGSASAGPQGGVNTATMSPLPLTGTTTFTPKAGEVAAVAAEARFSIASANAGQNCSPSVLIRIVGQETGLFVSPDADNDTATLVKSLGSDADGPYGLIDPGKPVSFTAELQGDADCTATSQLDRLEVRILQFK